MPGFDNLDGINPSHVADAYHGPAPARRAEVVAPAPAPAAPATFPNTPASAEAALPMGTRNFGDPLANLPPAARRKFLTICDATDAASAVVSSLAERMSEANDRCMAAEVRVRALRANSFERIPDDHPSLIAANEKVAEARAERERYRELMAARSEAARPLREIRHQIENYLGRVSEPLEEAPAIPAPELRKGENYAEAVARIRTKLSKLEEDRLAIDDAPIPSSIAKEKARAEIERLAAKGRPNVMALIESHDGSIQWPTKYEGAPIVWADGRPVGFAGRDGWSFDPLSFAVWLHRDELLRRIEAEIADKSDDASALTDETRAKKRAQTAGAILAAEREEERLIELAEEAGVSIGRREDADPRAILGIEGPAPRR